MISVVMATYAGDRPDHLEAAIKSVLSQDYSPLEIVVAINGPVPEENAALLRSLAGGDPRLRMIDLPENQGPAYARNRAVDAAEGDYIAILDADDLAHADRLARQRAFLEETGADLVGSHYRIIDEAGNFLGQRSVPLSPAALRRWSWIINPIAHSTVLARAEVLRQHPYPENLRYGEDYRLWVTLMQRGYVLRNQPACLADFRVYPDFLRKRQGWRTFTSDLGNKLAAARLQAWWLAPILIPLSMAIAAVRLLPAPVLRGLYALRGRARIGTADKRR